MRNYLSWEYELGRQLMTAETNAAIEGAIEARASEVIVSDGHSP
jgi:D-amino peptidase